MGRKQRIGPLAVAAAVLALNASVVFAAKTDVVVFDNGKEITGEVKDFTQGKLKFDTDQADNIYINWEYVHFLTASEVFEVFDTTGAVYYGSLGTTDTARELVVIGEEESVVLEMDIVVQFEPIEKTFWQRLDGNIDLGLSYTSADSSLQYSLDAGATYRQRKYSGSASLTSIQTRRDGVEDILRDTLTFKYTRYHTRRYFGTGTLEFSRNTELGIDFRTELGYAFGRYAIVTNRQRLSAGVGFSVTNEDQTGAESSETDGWGFLGVRYHFFLYHYPETDIVADLSVQPSITDWARTRVNVNLSLRREFMDDFTVSLSVYDNYDSEPPEGANAKHDLAVVLAFGWSP
jgi:putative salt-induced outer membrane protein YdiY